MADKKNDAKNEAKPEGGEAAPKKKTRSLGFANHYKARIEEAGEEYAAALHAADEVDRAPAIPESDEGLRDWKAYVADLNRREPPGRPPDSNR